MKIVLKLVLTLYIVGAVGIFALHTQMPVTFWLAVERSSLWPLWVTTGYPQGTPLRMDQWQE